MSNLLHIVAACTDRKRGEPLPHHRLGSHGHGPKRAVRWMRALRKRDAAVLRKADDLYTGNHWAIVRALPSHATAQGWTSRSWVASAGYGLASGDSELVPYAATFSPGHQDSVIDPAASDSPAMQAQRWWADLADGVSPGSPASIASLLQRDADAAVLVVASRSYIDAMADDLVDGLGVMASPARMVIVTSGPPARAELRDNVVNATGKMRSALGGPLTALHAGLARRLVDQLRPTGWRVDGARRLARQLEESAPEISAPTRDPMTDAEVRRFVREYLRVQPRASHTLLLRVLRASGRACEQKRFKSLFLEVKEQ